MGYAPAPAMPPYYMYPPSYFYGDPMAGQGQLEMQGMGPPMMFPSVLPGMASPPVDQPSGLQVVVHNLPWACTWQQLKDCFRAWNVERADIVEDQWGRSRGFGTVRFATPEDALAACEGMNNMQVEGRTISVRIDRFA